MSKNKIIFVKYVDLDKDFYTIKEICDMLDLDKSFLHSACEESGIRPQQNQYGEWGFSLYNFRAIHHWMYDNYNEKGTLKAGNGPWDD